MRTHPKRSGRLSVAGLCLLFAVLLVGMAIGAVLHAIHPVVCATFARPAGRTTSARSVGRTASALIRVAMSQESIVYKQDRTSIDDYEVFKNTQLALIKSPLIFTAALRPRNIANLSIVKQENDPLSWLQDELRAGYINDSEIMRVSLTAEKPDDAIKLVDAIVDAYIEEVVNKEERQRLAMSAQLTQIFNNKTNEVRNKRANLIRLAQNLNIPSSDASKTLTTVNIQELSELRLSLRRMEMNQSKAKGNLKEGQAMLERLDEVPVSEIDLEKLVRVDPICKQYLETIAGLRQMVTQQDQTTLPDDKKAAADRLAKQLAALEEEYEFRENEFRELIKAAKRAEIEEKIAIADVQVTILTEQIADLSVLVDDQRERVSAIGQSSVDIEMMSNELKFLEKALADISAQREKLAIESRARPRITRLRAAYLQSK